MASPRRPRGRPPLGCAWVGGHYVSVASGEPHCVAHSRERFLQRRRRYDKARYWDPAKNVRKQRLERSARKSGRLPKPIQIQLDEMAVADSRIAKPRAEQEGRANLEQHHLKCE